MAQYAILRFSKRKAGGVASADRHNERKKQAYKSNPNIDITRSNLNYHIVKPSGTYRKEWVSRTERAGCKVRSNSVVIVETLVTASPDFLNDLSPEEQRRFFEKATEFIGKKVGEDNIVSAVVHMDETTPHMHLAFVPITKEGKLSAKTILGNRADLSKWQDEFYEVMSRDFPDLDRGISSRITQRSHIPPYLYRQASELDKIYPQVIEAVKDINVFNSGAKRDQALKILSENVGKIKGFTSRLDDLMRRNDRQKWDLKDLKDEMDKTENQLIEYKNANNQLYLQNQELWDQNIKYKQFLSMIPQEVLDQILPKEQERHRDGYER